MIDKVWFDITTWLTKNYNEYYNSDNYKQTENIIRDYVDRHSTLVLNSEEFVDHYIEEIDDYAVDAIVHMIVDLVYNDHVNILESISTAYSEDFDDYYNDWLADLAILLVDVKYESRMRYQDDYIRSDTYDFYSVLNTHDKRQSIKGSMSRKEKYNLLDTYYSISTQEFPAHKFDT